VILILFIFLFIQNVTNDNLEQLDTFYGLVTVSEEVTDKRSGGHCGASC